MKEISPGVFVEKGKIFTKNLVPGKKVYGERLIKIKGIEYRQWSPYKSKTAAALKSGLKKLPLNPDSRVLYLGASQGTTPSHFSDIAYKGEIYCIELSPRNAVKLYDICLDRKNMIPIIEDATHPENYQIKGEFDILYQDISQKEQAKIILKNLHLLKKGGFLMMAIKARSISQKENKKQIFKRELSLLEPYFKIISKIDIHRYEKDHLFIVGIKK